MPRTSPSPRARRGARQASGLFLAALALLVPGVFLPMLRVDTLWIFTDRVSLASGIADLVGSGEYLLAGVLVLFSVLLPGAKIVLGLAAALRRARGRAAGARLLSGVSRLGRWSMLDVFVAGLLILSIKANALADATAEPGLYCFTGAVLCSLGATHRLLRD